MPLSAAMRTALLEELGLFGIRLAVALIRRGVATPRRPGRRAGPPQRARRARSVSSTSTSGGAAMSCGPPGRSRAVEQVLRSSPVPGDGRVWAAPRAGAAGLARPDGARPADPAARRRRAAAAQPPGRGRAAAGRRGSGQGRAARSAGRRRRGRAADGGPRRGAGVARARGRPAGAAGDGRRVRGPRPVGGRNPGAARPAGRRFRRPGRGPAQSASARSQARDERRSSAAVAGTISPACTRKRGAVERRWRRRPPGPGRPPPRAGSATPVATSTRRAPWRRRPASRRPQTVSSSRASQTRATVGSSGRRTLLTSRWSLAVAVVDAGVDEEVVAQGLEVDRRHDQRHEPGDQDERPQPDGGGQRAGPGRCRDTAGQREPARDRGARRRRGVTDDVPGERVDRRGRRR